MWKSKYDHYGVMDAILNILTNSELKKWHQSFWDFTHSNEQLDINKIDFGS